MSELDPFGAEQPIKRPVSNDREFQNGEPLFNEISEAIKNGTKNFVVYGPEKSGKTSFTNVLPDNLPVGFIGVRVELECHDGILWFWVYGLGGNYWTHFGRVMVWTSCG
jgi:hypothetical protein